MFMDSALTIMTTTSQLMVTQLLTMEKATTHQLLTTLLPTTAALLTMRPNTPQAMDMVISTSMAMQVSQLT